MARFHALGLPHTITNPDFAACAYTQKVLKFAKMMTDLGHEVIHYGHEKSDLKCSEHVTVVPSDLYDRVYGRHDYRSKFFKYNVHDQVYKTFYRNAAKEIRCRQQKGDFVLPFWGPGVRPVCDALKYVTVVEPGIGYAHGHWAEYKVFESYALYHAYYGLDAAATCKQSWKDCVIPNYFDLDDFEYRSQKENYFLFIGRVYPGKGIDLAVRLSSDMGFKLVVAGQKEEGYSLPSHVDYVGYADPGMRRDLMSRAKACLIPSMYLEPFGGVQVESLLSGTPTITTDWGAFAENNINGLTGYRCRTYGQFQEAICNIHRINPVDCRKMGESFSLEAIGPKYESFFNQITAYQGACDNVSGQSI